MGADKYLNDLLKVSKWSHNKETLVELARK